jgi:molybdopterin-binding protein
MQVSARNVLPGKVKAVTPGAVDSEILVELAPGLEVVAIIKASNVMIGVD